MKQGTGPDVLYYPFHLCHEETLERLLRRFRSVHFRDFMALQLTPFFGMTAFSDRMGDCLPELLYSGRLVQGYDVSGPISRDVEAAIDRDLSDEVWRSLFHSALRQDLRFQRGLFPARESRIFVEDHVHSAPCSVAEVRSRSARIDARGPAGSFEYGLALLKTSASLVHTYRLALTHGLQVATDSAAHYSLFERSCRRESVVVGNHLLLRNEY